MLLQNKKTIADIDVYPQDARLRADNSSGAVLRMMTPPQPQPGPQPLGGCHWQSHARGNLHQVVRGLFPVTTQTIQIAKSSEHSNRCIVRARQSKDLCILKISRAQLSARDMQKEHSNKMENIPNRAHFKELGVDHTRLNDKLVGQYMLESQRLLCVRATWSR